MWLLLAWTTRKRLAAYAMLRRLLQLRGEVSGCVSLMAACDVCVYAVRATTPDATASACPGAAGAAASGGKGRQSCRCKCLLLRGSFALFL